MAKTTGMVEKPRTLWRIVHLKELSDVLTTVVADCFVRQGHPRLHSSRWLALPFLATGHTTAARLGRWTHTTRQSANALLKNLCEHGYAEERPEPSNRRSIPVVLTAKGEAAVREAEEAAAHVLSAWTRSHEPGEADVAFEIVRQIVVMQRMDAMARL